MSGSSHDLIIIVDDGSPSTELIARRVREARVYCEIASAETSWEAIWARRPRGVIVAAPPAEVDESATSSNEASVLYAPVPVLAVGAPEAGWAAVLPQEETARAGTSAGTSGTSSEPMGEAIPGREPYRVQLYPEIPPTAEGQQRLEHFLYEVCGCAGDWTMSSFIDEAVGRIRELVGEKRVICALSGGVDSAVAAALVHRAIGEQLVSVFVDHGFMRKDEGRQVIATFRDERAMNVVHVRAEERFLQRLQGVSDPEAKRKRIGREFIAVFEEEARKLGDIEYLVQGTLYPDVVESGPGKAAVIKSHHNVGGLPERMSLKLLEPLRQLFKDEVRQLGRELGLPEDIVGRQPFPGPGLAIRIIGEVTPEKLAIVREADHIVVDEIRRAGLYDEVWQSFAVLTDTRTVGVTGDQRTYSRVVGVRAVTSVDGMTADWARLPWDVLARISTRIMNEVDGVNRVTYDISGKPPATIEWE